MLLAHAGAARAQDDPPETLPADPDRLLVFDAEMVEVGSAYQYGVIEHRFEFHNQSDSQDVVIDSVEALSPPGRAEYEPRRVPPGSNGFIRVYQPLGGELGRSSFRYRVNTDDPLFPSVEIVLRTFVQSAYDKEWPFLDFGDVDRSSGKTVTLEVSSREVDNLSVLRALNLPEFLELAELPAGGSGQRVGLDVTVLPGAPMGLQGGTFHLQTDLPHQRDYMIRFQANIFGDVVPSVNPLIFGATRVGESVEQLVKLTSRSGRPVRVSRLEDLGGNVEPQLLPCEGVEAGPACRLLRVTLPARHQGPARGELTVYLEGEDPLPIVYNGLVASPNARIRDLGDLTDGETRRVDYVEEDGASDQ